MQDTLTHEEQVWAGAYGYLRGLGLTIPAAKSYLAPILGAEREQVAMNSVERAPAHASVAAIEAAMAAGEQYAQRNAGTQGSSTAALPGCTFPGCTGLFDAEDAGKRDAAGHISTGWAYSDAEADDVPVHDCTLADGTRPSIDTHTAIRP